jgi:predicted nucleic acid-binding protein
VSGVVALDTSVLVSVLRDEERRKKALLRIQDQVILLPSIVVAELESLARQGRAPQAAVRPFGEMTLVEPLDEELATAAGRLHGELRAAGRSRVSLADTIVLATARRARVPLITFDNALEGEAGVEVL